MDEETEQPQREPVTAAEHVAAGTWTDLLDRLRERIDELQTRIEALEAQFAG